jgi:hypothetical protein
MRGIVDVDPNSSVFMHIATEVVERSVARSCVRGASLTGRA